MMPGQGASENRSRYPLVVIQNAGLNRFWIDRVPEQEGFEDYVVEAVSIAVGKKSPSFPARTIQLPNGFGT